MSAVSLHIRIWAQLSLWIWVAHKTNIYSEKHMISKIRHCIFEFWSRKFWARKSATQISNIHDPSWKL